MGTDTNISDWPVSARWEQGGSGIRVVAFARHMKKLREILHQADPSFIYSRQISIDFGPDRQQEAKNALEKLISAQHPNAQRIDDHMSNHATEATFIDPTEDPILIRYMIGQTELLLMALCDNAKRAETLIAAARCSLSGISREKNKVLLRTSFYTPNGVRTFSSMIGCPSWHEIRANYPAQTQQALEAVITGSVDHNRGRLLVWQGPPGTGKTFAIRSLMRAWHETYIPINVVDSDQFLDHPDYYYSLIEDRDKPVLFILEDSAEALLTETRAAHGSRMSKLLNLTDGLLAQGREDLFLVTFNEEVRKLDPAVVRPGRCLVNIGFREFSPTAARAWLEEHDVLDAEEMLPNRSYTLAELYARLNGDYRRAQEWLREPAGFAVG